MVDSPKFLDDDKNEKLDHSICYYDHLDPQHSYTVYAIPGGGYLNYMTVLSTIDLTKFDRCIIQETFDPRMILHTQLKYMKRVRNNIELNIAFFKKIDHRWVVILCSYWWFDFMKFIVWMFRGTLV